ncbi:MAG: hypothetical protein NVS4B13_00900 [Candidatus Elarobacter sp.]
MLGVALLGAATTTGEAPVVSISANAAADSKDFLSGVRLVQSLGARGQFVSYTWHDLEPTEGAYKLDDLRGGLQYLGGTLGDTLLFGVQVLNTSVKDVPADLRTTSFDDPKMQARARALLDRIARLPDARHIRYLSIGNEVDVYLAAHPDEWHPYEQFCTALIAHARKVLPGARVGVTLTAGALDTAPAEASKLLAMSDVAILTYYPLDDDFAVRGPHAARGDMDRLVKFAGSKQLVLQEVGYPTSPLLHGSEDQQARFFSEVFAQWRVYGRKIPFVNVILLHDPTEHECSALEKYYGLRGATFHAFLCTLGLRYSDGRPKKAFATMKRLLSDMPAK